MHVRTKICGITNPADALLAVECGADALGLNFYAPSPRCISAETARSIVQALPPFIEPIALLVNVSLAEAQRSADAIGVRTVQVHGALEGAFPPRQTRWIPAFPVRDEADLSAIQESLAKLKIPPAAILVDAHVPGKFGGTGQTAPWHLLANFRPGVPIILAGGLTPDNVAEAIRIVRPYAVDVASGVESSPGKKDAAKMRRFIDAVRNVSA